MRALKKEAKIIRLLPHWSEPTTMEVEYEDGQTEFLPLPQQKIRERPPLVVGRGSAVPEVDYWE